MPPPPGLDACRALLVYDGAARRIVTRLKYGHHRVALGWLADGLAGLMVPPPGVVVTWAPTTALRRRRRGFDQSQLIASAVARRWGVPRRRLLERAPGPAQTGRPLIDRSTGPRLAARRVTRGPVIVVDDVVTTGATLTAAAGALRSAGATWVGAVVVAHTPRRRR